jgi:hypothetical protein
MTAELEIELAVPVDAPAAASGRVRTGVLPEGRDPDNLQLELIYMAG